MAKNEKYTFTPEQIEFVKNVKKNNKNELKLWHQ